MVSIPRRPMVASLSCRHTARIPLTPGWPISMKLHLPRTGRRLALIEARPAPERWPWTALRAVLLVAYLAFVLRFWKVNGVPLERVQVLAWISGALLIVSTGRPAGGVLRIVRDWLPILVILAAYDLSRGAADTLGMPVQSSSIVTIERAITFGQVPTVSAQASLGPYDGPIRWWEIPVAFTYLSHFVVPFAVLAVLWVKRRATFRRYRNALFLITAMGLATYILVPATPPWLASRQGLIGPVQRTGLRGMEAFGLQTADALIHYGTRVGNAVAALPSLHAGWATLSALWLALHLRRRWWPLLFSYPLIMGVSLVISGEHYVFDILLGYLYAAVAVFALLRLERWWETRQALRAANGGSPLAEVADSADPQAVVDLTDGAEDSDHGRVPVPVELSNEAGSIR
ncbi:MAG: phosphatase PAP2 family protein [Acidimicrobiales bacterium]